MASFQLLVLRGLRDDQSKPFILPVGLVDRTGYAEGDSLSLIGPVLQERSNLLKVEARDIQKGRWKINVKRRKGDQYIQRKSAKVVLVTGNETDCENKYL